MLSRWTWWDDRGSDGDPGDGARGVLVTGRRPGTVCVRVADHVLEADWPNVYGNSSVICAC